MEQAEIDISSERKTCHEYVAEVINDYLEGFNWLKENYRGDQNFLISVVLYGGAVTTPRRPSDIDLLLVCDVFGLDPLFNKELRDIVESKIPRLEKTDSILADKVKRALDLLESVKIKSVDTEGRKLTSNQWGIEYLHIQATRWEHFFSLYRQSKREVIREQAQDRQMRPDDFVHIPKGTDVNWLQHAAATGILIAGHNLYHYKDLGPTEDFKKMEFGYLKDSSSLITRGEGKHPVFTKVDKEFLSRKN